MFYQKSVLLIGLVIFMTLACTSPSIRNTSPQGPDATQMVREMEEIFDAEPTVTATPLSYETSSFSQVFSIDHPGNWHILEGKNGLVVFSPEPLTKLQYLGGSPNWFLVEYGSSDALSGASEADLQNFMDKGHLQIEGQITNFTIDGRTAYKANYELSNSKGWVMLTTNKNNQQVILTVKGNPYSSPVSPGWDDYESIYEHMLSSIQFK